MIIQGEIVAWNDDKGYGFVQPDEGGDRLFVHIKSFRNLRGRPALKQSVSFDLSSDSQGRPCAINVDVLGSRTGNGKGRIKAILLVVCLGVLVSLGYWVNFFLEVLGYYLIISVFTFMMYAKDKMAAQKGKWRTAESTLHFFALIGGWPGAFLAQRMLRHKSSKRSFLLFFWITVIVHCGAVAFLLSSYGPTILTSLMERNG